MDYGLTTGLKKTCFNFIRGEKMENETQLLKEILNKIENDIYSGEFENIHDLFYLLLGDKKNEMLIRNYLKQ